MVLTPALASFSQRATAPAKSSQARKFGAFSSKTANTWGSPWLWWKVHLMSVCALWPLDCSCSILIDQFCNPSFKTAFMSCHFWMAIWREVKKVHGFINQHKLWFLSGIYDGSGDVCWFWRGWGSTVGLGIAMHGNGGKENWSECMNFVDD